MENHHENYIKILSGWELETPETLNTMGQAKEEEPRKLKKHRERMITEYFCPQEEYINSSRGNLLNKEIEYKKAPKWLLALTIRTMLIFFIKQLWKSGERQLSYVVLMYK